MPSVLLQERIDLQLHEHDSLHVDDEIREEIYAARKRHVRASARTDVLSAQRTLRSRGIRPSDSSFARAARRFKIRLYCLALTYNGSSSVGSEATADCAGVAADGAALCI